MTWTNTLNNFHVYHKFLISKWSTGYSFSKDLYFSIFILNSYSYFTCAISIPLFSSWFQKVKYVFHFYFSFFWELRWWFVVFTIMCLILFWDGGLFRLSPYNPWPFCFLLIWSTCKPTFWWFFYIIFYAFRLMWKKLVFDEVLNRVWSNATKEYLLKVLLYTV